MKKHLFPLLLLCLFSHTAYAQDDTEWFWALRENGELIAYSTDGDVNTLIAGGVESAQGHRLNHQSALVILTMRDDNRLYIYELTPTAAISQMSEWGAEELVLPIVTGIHFETYYPFATITIRPETGTVTALINFETDAVELIEGEVNQLEFSDDGEWWNITLTPEQLQQANSWTTLLHHLFTASLLGILAVIYLLSPSAAYSLERQETIFLQTIGDVRITVNCDYILWITAR
jgi:hypothetical protein